MCFIEKKPTIFIIYCPHHGTFSIAHYDHCQYTTTLYLGIEAILSVCIIRWNPYWHERNEVARMNYSSRKIALSRALGLAAKILPLQ
jgi:hypothetical protein